MMKNNLLFLCLMALIAVSSCKKGDDPIDYSGKWEGTFSGEDNGTFSVTISSQNQISGSGYSNNWSESFSLTGTVDADGAFNAGNASTGAVFTGAIKGTNISGNWNNQAASESGTFKGQKVE